MRIFLTILFVILLTGCSKNSEPMKKIVFLHHSTGYSIWAGNTNRYIYKITGQGDVLKYFKKHNSKNRTGYEISDRFFPQKEPYGWNNYPFDYYNIWVKNAGVRPYLEEPTLEILTADFDVIIFKHCFPVSNIEEDSGFPDIESPAKRIENYRMQYDALKAKMHQFPENKFIVWTPAVNIQNRMSGDEAIRTRKFRDWVVNEWDEKGDNIFVWDFYELETEGGLYLAEKNAYSPDNSHPGKEFSAMVAPLFSKFVIDVIESKIE